VSLLPASAFECVFGPLVGRRVGLAPVSGNAGDQLIIQATLQLLERFGIHWCHFDPDRPKEVDEILYHGGGNMGSRYPQCSEIRRRCLATGLPVTILPQSFSDRDDQPYHRVYVRERASLALAPAGAILAPDLALGLQITEFLPARRHFGLFLRRDFESTIRRPWLTPDPARRCRSAQCYLQLAARYHSILTDRLHFAIAGLITGRRVILLPNDYHKNQSMHETWLQELGCDFAASLNQGRERLGFHSWR
jgi:exopolysaccharide biosynthesis predicted pyruvyltransferase EpsI